LHLLSDFDAAVLAVRQGKLAQIGAKRTEKTLLAFCKYRF